MLEKILRKIEKLVPKSVYQFFQPAYHFLLAITGNIIYGFPGRELKVIGITGTNGKSTTVDLCTQVLKEADYKVGMISTIAIEIAGKRKDNITNRTTLGRWQTQKLLREMVNKKCEYVVLEVASEGIAWFRVWGIPFDVAVFTNLSPEHLNFHKTMENYRNTKGKLFENLKEHSYKEEIPKISIININDKEADFFLSFVSDKKIKYGTEEVNNKKDVLAYNIQTNPQGSDFKIKFNNKSINIKLNIPGDFNIYNALAAFACGLSQNIKPEIIKKALENIKGIAGRMESIDEGQDFSVIVDYAVTPNALEKIYKTIKNDSKRRLISVLGATGERDKSKRPKLGEIAAKFTDITIITDEEPYNEDPEKIIDDVFAGTKKIKSKNLHRISDRGTAIKFALGKAQKDDCVIITGIGHQKFRNVAGKKEPWNEREIIRKLLRKINAKKP